MLTKSTKIRKKDYDNIYVMRNPYDHRYATGAIFVLREDGLHTVDSDGRISRDVFLDYNFIKNAPAVLEEDFVNLSEFMTKFISTMQNFVDALTKDISNLLSDFLNALKGVNNE